MSKKLVVEAEKLFSALRECPEGKFCETVTTTGDHDNCDKCWSDALEVRPLTAAEMRAGEMVELLKVAQCPNCDGSGVIMVQTSCRQVVTHEMALDACCPEMEGSLYSDDEWEPEQCRWCYERNALIAFLATPEQGQGQEQEATYGPIKLCPHCQRAMTPNTICGHCGWSAEQEVQR